MFSNVWFITESAMRLVARAVAAEFSQPHAGAADDAERSGLPLAVRGNVAVINITGPMVKGDSFLTKYYGYINTNAVRLAVNAAAVDENIDTILLNVDSPGGSVAGLPELGDAVAQAATIKTVVAQVSGMAFSAAYYVASQASRIYLGRMDMVGSIGVRMMLYDFSAMFEKAGVKAIPIDTGVHKSAGAEGTPITDEQIAEFQRIVNGYFDDFKSAVARGRGMSMQQLDPLADGRTFFAGEAMQYGLVDGIQTIEQTLKQYAAAPRGRSTMAARKRLGILN